MEINNDVVVSIIENFITGVCIFELKNGKFAPIYINDGLHRMLGYSSSEMGLYLRNIKRSIIPEDIPAFEQAIKDVLKADGAVDIEFRTVTGSGALRWLQVRGNLYSKEGDTYIIVCTVIDATERKVAEEELKLQAERLHILSQADHEKILDYNAKTDVLTVRFNNENGLTNEKIIPYYVEHFDVTIFHPEDVENYLDIFRSLLVSPKCEEIELRSKRFDEDYRWYQLNLTSIAGMEGYVTRIVGRMVDIHDKKMRELELTNLAETDGLTQIYNKTAVNHQVTEFLSQKQNEDIIHAFMIIDLDNFKSVNDCLGHAKGDEILADCAAKLMNAFKRTDIIGRIGGDEFAVFAKDIGTISNADILATKLVQDLCWNLDSLEGNIHVTGSIGIGIYPYHGATYADIFDKADKALYSVKANGKSGYQIYNSAHTRAEHIHKREENYQIDPSDYESHSIEDMVIRILYEDKIKESAIRSILELLMIKLKNQRAFVSPKAEEIKGDYKSICVAMTGYENGMISLEEKEEKARLFEGIYGMYPQLSVIHEYDDISEELRRYMLKQSVTRIIYYPISENEQYRGSIVFEECEDTGSEMEESVIEELRSALRLLNTCTMQLNFHGIRYRDLVTQIEMLDNMDSYIYLVDKDSYKIKFINKKIVHNAKDIQIGDLCYKVIKNQDSPCKDCLMNKLNTCNFHDRCSDEIFNYSLRTWTKESACWFECGKEESVCMISETDISDYFAGF